jgi:hypothetical protein
MKKILIFSILTFTLLLFSNVESKGQCTSCPSGFVTTAFPITLKSGCEAWVHYCYLCSPTGNPVAQFCGIYIPKTTACNGILINDAFWEMLREEMMIDLVYSACFDIYGELPPCSTSFRKSLEIVVADCMEVYEDVTSPEIVILRPCNADPGLCTKEYEVCWNGTEMESNVVNVNFEPGECDNLPFVFDIFSLPTYCFSSGCY